MLIHNNRDHKKIVIIDGKIAYTGGANIADEYINKKVRFGHWKDTGIKIIGDATKSFTLMFLETWHYFKDSSEDWCRCNKDTFWRNNEYSLFGVYCGYQHSGYCFFWDEFMGRIGCLCFYFSR